MSVHRAVIFEDCEVLSDGVEAFKIRKIKDNDRSLAIPEVGARE